jgi:hypothetical protein
VFDILQNLIRSQEISMKSKWNMLLFLEPISDK